MERQKANPRQANTRKSKMNRGERDNRDTRNRSPARGHNSENTKRQGRQPEDNRKREEVDEEEEELQLSPTEDEDDAERKTRRMDERSKDLSGQTRERWKDAGVDQVKMEKRKARQQRMVKVMKLFEDTVLIDKISLKDRKGHMDDIRTRLAEIKREHNERVKQNVTSHWTNLTKQGGNSRASTQPEEKLETAHRKDTGNRDNREKDGTRHRPVNSGHTHDMSSNTGKKDNRGDNSPEVDAGRQGASSGEGRRSNRIRTPDTRDDVARNRGGDESKGDNSNPRKKEKPRQLKDDDSDEDTKPQYLD